MINNSIFFSFGLSPEKYSIKQVHLGHINQSFQLLNNIESNNDFFLQKINPTPFTSVQELMNNIEQTIKHQRNTNKNNFTHLELIHTINNDAYFVDSEGSNWRLFKNLDDYNIIKPTDSQDHIYRMGLAYGGFIKQMETMDPNGLFITIPNFHNVKTRLLSLQKSIKNNCKNRLKLVKNELKIVDQFHTEMSTIQDLIESGKIPTRITHNDTKASNVMIHEVSKKTCVIDLDTVMQSSLLFDYGDSIRSIISNAKEDSLENHELDIDKKEAYHEGFTEALKNSLVDLEISLLNKSCVLMPYIMGVRFLTDYLNGDTYYSIKYPNQNLLRAQNQLKLAKKIHSL